MEDRLYVMFIDKGKEYKKINKAMVIKHVEYIKNIDETGKLKMCGAFEGYPGVAGMLILKVGSYDEAEEICKSEPFVAEGFATYRLVALHEGHKENNYLL